MLLRSTFRSVSFPQLAALCFDVSQEDLNASCQRREAVIVGHTVLGTVLYDVMWSINLVLLHSANIKCIPAVESSLSAAESNQRRRDCRSDLRPF